MKITRRKLRSIIKEEFDRAYISAGSPETVAKALKTYVKWNEMRSDYGGPAERDPSLQGMLHKFWAATEEEGWEGTGPNEPWSAAFVSYVEDDDWFTPSIRHADYMDDAIISRIRMEKGYPESGEHVAFSPEEIIPAPGDKRCYPRDGGNHCDICLDVGCKTVVGGNVGDDITIRSSDQAPSVSMFITKLPG